MTHGKMIVGLLSILIAAPALAGVSMRTRNCGEGYGPSASNLSVYSDSSEEFVSIGYSVAGLFFQMNVAHCKNLRLNGLNLDCNGETIGKVGKFEITDDGEPVAPLTLDTSINATISGSCRASDRSPLTVTIH